jgi:hypothetical protein
MTAASTLPPKGYSLAPIEPGSGQPHISGRGRRRKHILPGFHLTLGYTLIYLSAIVLLPLLALLLKTVTPTADYPDIKQVVGHVFEVATDTRSLDSYKLSFGISFAAALLNGIFGFIAAWTLIRYQFPGKKLIDALVDLPSVPDFLHAWRLSRWPTTRLVWLAHRVHLMGNPDCAHLHRFSIRCANTAACPV